MRWARISEASRGATTCRGLRTTTPARSRSSRSKPATSGGTVPKAGCAISPTRDLLAVRVDHDGAVRIERLDADPAPDHHLVERLRRVYEDDIAEAELPSLCTDLVFALLVDDPTTFDPAAASARRAARTGGARTAWRFRRGRRSAVACTSELSQRVARVHDAYHDDHELAHEVLDVLDVADEPARRPTAQEHARRVWKTPKCAGECSTSSSTPTTPSPTDRRRDWLRGAARRCRAAPTERMVADWVSATSAERAGDVLAAEAHLHIAMEADPEWGPLVDRAAWYASDRGDASRAVKPLAHTRSARPGGAPDRRSVRAPRRSEARPQRSCWCGSGRKLKLCHAGTVEPIPLPDRCCGWPRRPSATSCATAAKRRSTSPTSPRSLPSTIDDSTDLPIHARRPIVIDLALTELGWFERFCETVAPLLPDDEALLATSWLLVDRTVYEVEATRPGDGSSCATCAHRRTPRRPRADDERAGHRRSDGVRGGRSPTA